MKKKAATKNTSSPIATGLPKEASSALTTPAADAAKAGLFQNDWVRAGLIVILAAALGLTTNAFSRKPVPVLASDGPGARPEKGPRVSASDVAAALKSTGVLFLDVRDAAAFAKEHPAGAVNLPITQFLDSLTSQNVPALMASAKKVVLVCDGEDCSASDRAYKDLAALKHPNLKVLEGGWAAYTKAGLPTVKGVAQ